MQLILALVSGLIFGLGLALSSMVNPAKIIGFLDVAGQWDPTLAFVMGGALLVTVPAFQWLLPKCDRPWFAASFSLPKASELDKKLLAGSALFGIGWGIGGFCPGPAISALVSGATPVFVFVGAMLVGVLAHKVALERN